MNLHWGKTLEHKWVMVKNRPMNYTIYNQYNYTEYKLTAHKYYWSEQLANSSSRSTGNQSALYAENQFLKKSKIMTDLVNPSSVRSQSFTTVVVIASIFLFLTMTITAAVVVFCRKRNSVFAFQKSEQEDVADYEMDDINTDVEYTETEFESETESLRPSRKSLSHASGTSSVASGSGISPGPSGYCDAGGGASGGREIDSDYENSPARRPLVSGVQIESEADDSPVRRQHTCRCGGNADPRGQYQRMVVTAVLEKPQQSSPLQNQNKEDPDSMRTHYIHKLDPRLYYPGFEGDPEILAAAAAASSSGKPPIINVTYADDPPAYDSLDYFHHNSSSSSTSSSNGGTTHTVTVDVENYTSRFPLPPPPPLPPLPPPMLPPEVVRSGAEGHYENLPCRDSQVQTDKSAFPPAADVAVVFVKLPPKDCGSNDAQSSWPQVEYVDLPPKKDPSSSIDPSQCAAPPPLPPITNPLSVPTTPTTPLAPPSTPTGGVLGIGLGVVGVVSMSPADETEEDSDWDRSTLVRGGSHNVVTFPPTTTGGLPRYHLPAYSQLDTRLQSDVARYSTEQVHRQPTTTIGSPTSNGGKSVSLTIEDETKSN